MSKPHTQPSSTGGTITYTKTGLIHTAGRVYTGSLSVVDGGVKAKKS